LRKFGKYLLFIFLINLVFFLALEGILRLVPFLPKPGYFDEFKDQQGKVWVQYKLGVNKPKFLKQKPEGLFRIFAFGGSTIMGSPYYGRSSFPRMLEYALRKAYPEKEVEVINLGASGMNSLEVKSCLLQSLKYQPDLVLIYSGQNELFVASLVPDYQHPLLDRILDQLRLHSRLYQLVRSFDKLFLLIPAFVGTHQEVVERLGVNLESPAPESQPVTEEFRKQRMLSYQYHLERMLSVLKRKKIPTLLCAVTVNLKDWPPEWLPYPQGLSEEQTEFLIKNLAQAYTYIFEGRLREAEQFLDQAKSLAPDYAMYQFLAGWLEEKRGDFSSAKEHFLLARKLDNSRHRAPPEINQIIRRLAQKYPVILVDVESLFFQQAKTTPGFDLFVDHCHPTLFGQWLIARAIFQKIIQEGFFPEKNLPFPPLEKIMKNLEIDEDYLAQVKFRLSIYYLLQRHLADFDAQTRNFLKEVIAHQPENLLARFCLISLYLELGWEEKAKNLLLQTLQRAPRNQLQMMLYRYFYPHILMQGNYFLFSLNQEPTIPPLRGVILVRSSPELSWKKPIYPLDKYQWIFQYQESQAQLENVREKMNLLALAHQQACQQGSQKLDLIAYLSKNRRFIRASFLELGFSEEGVKIKTLGENPYFIFPIQIIPLAGKKLELKLKFSPSLTGTNPQEFNWLEIYWSKEPEAKFSEAFKIQIPYLGSDKVNQLSIDLSKQVHWLGTEKIFYLRIDPTSFPGEVWLTKFTLEYCSP